MFYRGGAILTRKVGHTGLVFGVRSGFVSRSVHAGLQVSVCSGYDLCHPIVNIQTDTRALQQIVTVRGLGQGRLW